MLLVGDSIARGCASSNDARVSFSSLERFVATSGSPASRWIDVFGMDLDAKHDHQPVVEAILDPGERSEIGRLADPRDRRRLATSRAALRLLASAYLGTPAVSVPVARDVRGKPYLAVGGAAQALQLGCARSGRLAVFAVGAPSPLGVDIEVVSAERFPDRVAEVALSQRELRLHAALPAAARSRWLARAWVCKEAILKGLGCGLWRHPASVDCGPPADERPAARPAWRTAHGLPAWSLCELEWAASVVAIAVHGRPTAFRLAELTWDA